eukprot:gb/GFBE01078204.1/.p1 GENE.gb/GFBE01078204.1/~~gb/GFBE01078204.1/.p1  ORF type:complete len:435 (+),score=83.50 gb/GFBE01078204.1/:1-1305(+)
MCTSPWQCLFMLVQLAQYHTLAWEMPEGMPCNGSPDFCDLPLRMITLPGTHNSGAVKDVLDKPKEFYVPMPDWSLEKFVDCYYINQNLDYTAQLDAGVRFFDVDICGSVDGDTDTLFDCHPPNNDLELASYGGPFADTVAAMKQWLDRNDGEVVVVAKSNVELRDNAGLDTQRWVSLFEAEFGPCSTGNLLTETFTRNANPARPALSCAVLTEVPTSVTMSSLIRANLRMLIMHNERDVIRSTWSGKYEGLQENKLGTHLHNLAIETGEDRARERLYAFDVYTSISVSSKLHDCKGLLCWKSTWKTFTEYVDTFEVACNKKRAEKVNKDLLLGSESANEGKCSDVEVAHQVMLNKGSGIFALKVDYVEGETAQDLVAMVRRMNEASVRKQRGESLLVLHCNATEMSVQISAASICNPGVVQCALLMAVMIFFSW